MDVIRTWSYYYHINEEDLKEYPLSKRLNMLKILTQCDICGFRTIYAYRTRTIGGINKLVLHRYKPTQYCVLDCPDIEPGGFVAHHPFSTYLNCEHIGYGCTFRNNTTFGNKMVNGNLCRPWVGRNVFVGPNVVVIGNVKIGDNSVIGAGAVVTKDVPANAVVVGNPAYIIKENGIVCRKKL